MRFLIDAQLPPTLADWLKRIILRVLRPRGPQGVGRPRPSKKMVGLFRRNDPNQRQSRLGPRMKRIPANKNQGR